MATGGEGPKGIDVSKWQASTPSLAGLSFLFARASIGTVRDEMYATHIRNARRAGLLVGAYHFNHGPLSIRSQVDTFLDAAGDVDFYALDVEGRDAFTRAQTEDFIKRVQATGRKCGLYMSESQFYDAGQDFHWVANWTREPSRSYHFWQWQGSPLDRNTFNGTIAELRALAAKGDDNMAQLSITDTTPKILVILVGAKAYMLDGTFADYTFTQEYTRFSPYGVGTRRAYYANVDGKRVLRLVDKFTASDVPAPEPPPDTTPFSQAQIDAAKAVAHGEGIAEGTATEKSRLRKLLGI